MLLRRDSLLLLSCQGTLSQHVHPNRINRVPNARSNINTAININIGNINNENANSVRPIV